MATSSDEPLPLAEESAQSPSVSELADVSLNEQTPASTLTQNLERLIDQQELSNKDAELDDEELQADDAGPKVTMSQQKMQAMLAKMMQEMLEPVLKENQEMKQELLQLKAQKTVVDASTYVHAPERKPKLIAAKSKQVATTTAPEELEDFLSVDPPERTLTNEPVLQQEQTSRDESALPHERLAETKPELPKEEQPQERVSKSRLFQDPVTPDAKQAKWSPERRAAETGEYREGGMSREYPTAPLSNSGGATSNAQGPASGGEPTAMPISGGAAQQTASPSHIDPLLMQFLQQQAQQQHMMMQQQAQQQNMMMTNMMQFMQNQQAQSSPSPRAEQAQRNPVQPAAETEEQIKSISNVTLTALAHPKEPEPATRFSTWMTRIKLEIAPLSENAQTWWEQHVEIATDAYKKYIHLPPLQKVLVEVDVYDQPNFQRLAARVASMLLKAIPQTLSDDMADAGQVSPAQILFELMKAYEPGGTKEREEILEKIEKPGESSTPEDAEKSLRLWERRLRRIQELGATVPDASRLSRALKQITGPIIASDEDFKFRAQTTRAQIELDTNPTSQSVTLYLKFLKAEIKAKVALTMSQQEAKPTIKQADVGTHDSQQQLKGKGKGKGKMTAEEKAKIPCLYFDMPSGCGRGKSCDYLHRLLKPEEKRCFTCGSSEHSRFDCTSGKQPNPKARAAKATKQQGQEQDATQALQQTEQQQQPTPQQSLTSSPAQSLAPSRCDSPRSQNKDADAMQAEIGKMINKLFSNPGAKVITLSEIRRSKGRGLVDSGASNPVREENYSDKQHVLTDVDIDLALGKTARMKFTPLGTVIGPKGVSPILPFNDMIRTCGVILEHDDVKIRLYHPVKGYLKTYQDNNLLEIDESVCLDLIQEVEDAKRKSMSPCAQSSVKKMIEYYDQQTKENTQPQSRMPCGPQEWIKAQKQMQESGMTDSDDEDVPPPLVDRDSDEESDPIPNNILAQQIKQKLLDLNGNKKLLVKKLTAEEKLAQHKADNHVTFDRNCLECLSGSLRDRCHRRSDQAEPRTLSVDVAGPFKTSEHHPYKFFLQATYTLEEKKPEETDVQDADSTAADRTNGDAERTQDDP